MNSLEWRIKRLEDQILGKHDRLQTTNHNSIFDQLSVVAQQYQNFSETTGNNYFKFQELYNKYKDSLSHLNSLFECNEMTKAELVLAYEEDLVKYMSDIKLITEKAGKVLDDKRWPDLTPFEEKLEKLKNTTFAQEQECAVLDKRLGEIVKIYKEVLDLLQSNTVTWNNRLEAYECADRDSEEDE